MRRAGSIIPLLLVSLSFAQEQAPKLDTGDTAWILVSSALVMLMTLPGLALFYGGMAKKKDTLNTIAMSFVAYCIASVVWIIYGYTLAFGQDIGGVIGAPSKLFLQGVGIDSLQGTIPELLFAMFQLTFAAITVALASGSFVERLKFSAWIIFVLLWVSLVYVPVAHWVWGGGFLAKDGALDFAGGTVVHINAGIAGLVGAFILGRRKEAVLLPNNLPMVALGGGLLWFGWFGFNAGSALGANSLAAVAMLNTNIATAVAALGWMFAEWFHRGKPTVLGLASGVIAGLVAITPAAGFVNVVGAVVIGVIAGVVCYFMVAEVKQKLGYDDALDVFGIHGVAGIIGALLTGVFADPSINQAGKGLLYGNPAQLLVQIKSVIVTVVYSGVLTAVIFFVAKATHGLKVNGEEEITGLDRSQHGESAYNIS
ncbi:MAG: ammonium transporter [Aquificaceae bacterium]